MTERMFHHSLVSFILPCNTVCLLVCLYVCCVSCTYSTVGPMGADRSPLGLLLLSFHSRFLGLNAAAKKRKKKHDVYKWRRNIFQQCNSVCFVSVYAQIHSVSSFNDDDFTKTVFIIREDTEYLFTGSCVCACMCVCVSVCVCFSDT